MANREANFVNNWSTVLDADMAPTDLSAIVPDTSSGPPSPCYLDIDYTDDDKREYIYFDGEFTGTAFTTSTIANRYLAGSAAPSGITHTTGAVVRAITAAQVLEDIHDRITANAADIATLEGHTHEPDATGAPLATVVYRPVSTTSVVAGSTSYVTIDATNLRVTFAAPASGSVYVELSVRASASDPSYAWALYDAASGGSLMGEVDSLAHSTASPVSAVVGPVSGLTAEQSYTLYWRHKRGSGSAGLSFGGERGPALMRVWEL